AGHGYNDPGAVGNGTNERDFIRKYITPNIAKYLRHAGHEVALYGGSSQSQDMYQDTAYGVNVGNKKDYGLYWVKSQGYDIVLEIHLDAAGE
ncbi:N-acetylmuramoyl-L-alanine amidase, partial [Staphylococcus aureus]